METGKEICSKMTLEEKAGLCSGADFWHLKVLERLGIAMIPFHYSNPKASLYFKFSGEGSCSMKTIGFLS